MFTAAVTVVAAPTTAAEGERRLFDVLIRGEDRRGCVEQAGDCGFDLEDFISSLAVKDGEPRCRRWLWGGSWCWCWRGRRLDSEAIDANLIPSIQTLDIRCNRHLDPITIVLDIRNTTDSKEAACTGLRGRRAAECEAENWGDGGGLEPGVRC
jgi:hypothetical protein